VHLVQECAARLELARAWLTRELSEGDERGRPLGMARSVATRSAGIRVVYYVVGHTWDICGQMVVYLRINGITAPASQRF